MPQEDFEAEQFTSSFRKMLKNIEAVNLRHENDHAHLVLQHQLPGNNYESSDRILTNSAQSGQATMPQILYLSSTLINFNHNLGNIRYNHRSMRVRRFTPLQNWTDSPCLEPRGIQTQFYAY